MIFDAESSRIKSKLGNKTELGLAELKMGEELAAVWKTSWNVTVVRILNC